MSITTSLVPLLWHYKCEIFTKLGQGGREGRGGRRRRGRRGQRGRTFCGRLVMWTCIANCPFLIWPKRTAEVQRVGGLLQKTTAQDSVKDNPDAAITARTVYSLGPPKTKPTLAWVTQATQVCMLRCSKNQIIFGSCLCDQTLFTTLLQQYAWCSL